MNPSVISCCGELICLLRLPKQRYHRLSSLNSRSLSSHSSGGWKSRIRVPTGLVSPLSYWCCLLPLSARGLPSGHICVLIPSPYTDYCRIGLGHYPKDLILNKSSLERAYLQTQSYSEVLGVRTSTNELGAGLERMSQFIRNTRRAPLTGPLKT